MQKTQRELWVYKNKSLESAIKYSDLHKQQLNDQLKYKNNQLTNFALHIKEKAELLDGFFIRLKKIQRTSDRSKLDKDIQDLILLVKQNQNVNKVKLDTQKEVERIHESFAYNLDKKYPNLTEHEKKIATLLRIDLSSKNISTLLNVLPSTIDNYRHSIRKKLNIQPKANISDFLKSI